MVYPYSICLPGMLLLVLLVQLSCAAQREVNINISPTNTGYTVTIYTETKQDCYIINFEQNGDKIFQENFGIQFWNLSGPQASGSKSDSSGTGDNENLFKVYVAEEYHAAVQISSNDNGQHELNGFIGDMLITYDGNNKKRYYESSSLECEITVKDAVEKFFGQPKVFTAIPKSQIRLLVVVENGYEFVDNSISRLSLHGYLSILFNAVNYRMGIVSNRSIHVKVAGVIVAEGSEFFTREDVHNKGSESWDSVSSDSKTERYYTNGVLANVQNWIYKNRHKIDSNYNLVTLISPRTFVSGHGKNGHGVASIEGACDWGLTNKMMDGYLGVTVVQHNGNLDRTRTFVHEFYHLFGARHETGKYEKGYIMSDSKKESVIFEISDENQQKVSNFLRNAHCLRENANLSIPAPRIVWSVTSTKKALPNGSSQLY